jgi:hypothetical protein
MLRIALAALAVAGVVSSASAQGQMNCANTYKDFWEKLMREHGGAKLSGDQLANSHRVALRAYDSCTAGDESFARQLFDRLQREAGSAKK